MSNLANQLNKLDVSKLKMKNGKSILAELKRHAEILADCIMDELDMVYDSYSPKVYKRSYGLYNSLYIDGSARVVISAKGAGLSIGLHFDDEAIHRSFMGEDANTATLLNEGWQTHGSFASVPYLGYREGTYFIEKGIMKYKKKVQNPFGVKFTLNGEVRSF